MTSPGWAYQRPDSAQALRGNGQTLRLRATDAAGAGGWLIRRGTDAATWREDPAAAGGTVGGAADVTVSGPAAALLLVLTRRRPIAAAQAGGLQVSGDPDLFAHWVEHTAHQAG